MIPADIKKELWKIAKPYPTLCGLLMRPLTEESETTVGQHWAELLADSDSGHLADVCEEYATLRKELPKPTDQLVFVIRTEVRDRMYRDQQRWHQHQKYFDQKKLGAMDLVKADKVGHLAIQLGEELKQRFPHGRSAEYELEKKRNDVQVDELIRWRQGGERPEWVTG